MKKKSVFLLSLALFLGGALVLGSCSKADQPQPIANPQPPREVPAPGTPGTDVGTSLGTIRLSWSPLDWQEWTHDASGKLLRYGNQYNWVQGTNEVRRLAYEFGYGPTGHLLRLETHVQGTLGTYVVLEYDADRLVGAAEFRPDGRLVARYQYRFSDQRQLIEQVETRQGTTWRQTRHTFAYDGRGNLTEVREWGRSNENVPFALQTRMTYEQYDDRPATPDQLFQTYPYLPDVRFRVNNPGLRRVFGADGQPLPGTERYLYTFDAAGRPATKTVTGEGGTRTGQFEYGPKF